MAEPVYPSLAGRRPDPDLDDERDLAGDEDEEEDEEFDADDDEYDDGDEELDE
jgi:hypothetical protein